MANLSMSCFTRTNLARFVASEISSLLVHEEGAFLDEYHQWKEKGSECHNQEKALDRGHPQDRTLVGPNDDSLFLIILDLEHNHDPSNQPKLDSDKLHSPDSECWMNAKLPRTDMFGDDIHLYVSLSREFDHKSSLDCHSCHLPIIFQWIYNHNLILISFIQNEEQQIL